MHIAHCTHIKYNKQTKNNHLPFYKKETKTPTEWHFDAEKIVWKEYETEMFAPGINTAQREEIVLFNHLGNCLIRMELVDVNEVNAQAMNMNERINEKHKKKKQKCEEKIAIEWIRQGKTHTIRLKRDIEQLGSENISKKNLPQKCRYSSCLFDGFNVTLHATRYTFNTCLCVIVIVSSVSK